MESHCKQVVSAIRERARKVGLALAALPIMALAQTQALSVDQAVSEALLNNKQLQAAQLELKRGMQAVAEAKTTRLPQFQITTLAGGALAPIEFQVPAGALGTYAATGPIPASNTSITTPRRFTALVLATVTQPITQLRKTSMAVEDAVLASHLTEEHLRERRLEVVQEVRTSYVQLLQTQLQKEALKVSIRHTEELSALVERRLAERTALEADSLDVKSRLSQQKFELVSLANTYDSQRESFNYLLGRGPEVELALLPLPSPAAEDLDLAGARRAALEARPEVRQAEIQSARNELAVKRTRADYLPDVSLQLSYFSLPNINLAPHNITNAGLLFQWQPFDWGQKRRRLEQQEVAVQQARLQLDDAAKRVLLEVGATFRKLQEARAAVDVRATAREAIAERLRVTTNRYEQKAALLTEVLEVQASLAQAESQYQQAIANVWIARANFDRAIGRE